MSADTGATENPEMPEPTLSSLAQLLFFPGMIATGRMPDPSTGETRVNIELARFHVGILETLQQKSEGNRTDDESQLLEQMLHTLRMAFIEATGGEQAQ